MISQPKIRRGYIIFSNTCFELIDLIVISYNYENNDFKTLPFELDDIFER